jgi:hypothetical protein
MPMTKGAKDGVVLKPTSRQESGQGDGQQNQDSSSGVWGDLLTASPWSSRPFKNFQNMPMLPFAEIQELKPESSKSDIWDPGWSEDRVESGDGIEIVADPDPEPAHALSGAIIDVEAEIVTPADEPIEQPCEEIAPTAAWAAVSLPEASETQEETSEASEKQDETSEASEKQGEAKHEPPPPPVAPPPLVKPAVSSLQTDLARPVSAAKQTEARPKSLPAKTVQPNASQKSEVPVENLFTGVVSLIGNGVGGAVGFAAYAGAITASALGFGGKKKRPQTKAKKK